jgi:hypothetical protein
MDDFSKRDLMTIIIGVLVIGALSVWATFAVMPYFFPAMILSQGH